MTLQLLLKAGGGHSSKGFIPPVLKWLCGTINSLWLEDLTILLYFSFVCGCLTCLWFVSIGGLTVKVRWLWSSPVRRWRIWSELCFRIRRGELQLWPKSNRFLERKKIPTRYYSTFPLWKIRTLCLYSFLFSVICIKYKHLHVYRLNSSSQKWLRCCHWGFITPQPPEVV